MGFESVNNQIPPVAETTPAEKYENADGYSLQGNSLELANLYLAGTETDLNEMKMQPGTWNENQGVIVYADKDGKVYATPGSEQAHEQLEKMKFQKDEGIGVPHLNDLDVWGTEERRPGMTSLRDWLSLSKDMSEHEVPVGVRENERQDTQIETNAEKLAEAQEVLGKSLETLEQLPIAERFQIIKNVRWDRWEGQESGTIPEEILDAEAKIYKTYHPSEKLQQFHESMLDGVITKVKEENPLKLEKRWKEGSVEERRMIANELVEKFCSGYGIKNIGTVLFDTATTISETGDSPDAGYQPTGTRSELGVVVLSSKKLQNFSFESAWEVLAHEVSHAYQDAAKRKLIALDQSFTEDIEWFNMALMQETYRSADVFKKSYERYKSLPHEQDSFAVQAMAQKKMEQAMIGYKNEILFQNGLPDLKTLEGNARLADWAEQLMQEGQVQSGEDIIKIASEKLSELGKARITVVFLNEDAEGCKRVIQELQENKRRADALFESVASS